MRIRVNLEVGRKSVNCAFILIRVVFLVNNETSMRTVAIPTERSLHITEGVAKHAKTSSVQAKCVR